MGIKEMQAVDEYLGCFGNFSLEDAVCRKWCAINLRCAIEADQRTRLELFENRVAPDETTLIFQ